MPFNTQQEKFIDRVSLYLITNGFTPRTLGVTDFSMSVPLTKIKIMMNECYGLLSIAFKRTYVKKGTVKHGADLIGQTSYSISDCWLTSPYCQVEPSMALQIDMPFLIFREKGVIDEGILKKGAFDSYMPEFDIDSPINDDSSINNYFEGLEWNQLFIEWKQRVLKYQTIKQFEADNIIKHIISCSICEEKEISSKELYNAFNKTIDNERLNWSGEKLNDYKSFVQIIRADDKFEERYRIYGHSLMSDYITICNDYF